MKIVFTPDWFASFDIFIELFSFIILFLFFFLAMRNFKLSRNKNSFYLGLGFFLIALAEIFTILTKVVLYYDSTFTQNVGQMIVTYNVVKSVDIFYYIGFFLHKLFTLAGFYIIYKIPTRKGTAGDFILAISFLIISSLFSNTFYYVFHLTALLLIFLIIMNYQEIYKKNKSENTKLLIISFVLLAFSQMMFILSQFGVIYVAAQIIQLISYIILLLLIIRITKHGQKKKPY
ncbi:MAG: hypothetical protein Q7R52_05355 [archaeon]|nr:hypothetical protein [archaeon]